MPQIYLVSEILLSAIAGYVFTKTLIHYSIKHALLDKANARSSHIHPTPRIGGISFVTLISLILAGSYIMKLYNIPANLFLILLVPSLFVATISIIDDIKGGISRLARLICHFIAISFVAYQINIPVTGLYHFVLLTMLLFGIVWIINLYNFMDGIDGIAASQAVFVILASSCFAFLSNNTDWAIIQVTLIGPILGFLLLNWQPAKTFMGDIGSTYLGTLLPCILLISVLMGSLTFWSCIILLGTFLVDATWTLFYRLLTGQKWYHPHRSHVYQILSRKMDSHAKVSLGNVVINIIWLLPLSYGAYRFPQGELLFTAVALLPLILICIIVKAGKSSSN